jgi:hypothetical protein
MLSLRPVREAARHQSLSIELVKVGQLVSKPRQEALGGIISLSICIRSRKPVNEIYSKKASAHRLGRSSRHSPLGAVSIS